ncbi:MAG: hypothetical protein Kow0029_32220 [Candidatus Rifleibacteriota bacterium]
MKQFFFFMVLLFIATHHLPAYAGKSRKAEEKRLLGKARELSVEGQIDMAEGLMGRETDKKRKKNEEDSSYSMIFSMLWGAFGFGYFAYGKKQSRGSFLLSGIILMVYPMFFTNFWGLLISGIILIVAPFKLDF